MILIAGAGLAGLSAAFHLKDREYRIVERESRPGGLCRTEKRGNYFFDHGGHALHIRGDYVKGLARDLLGEKLLSHQRRAAIHSRGTLTPYPFQANTHGLPAAVVRDCVLGFVEAMLDQAGAKGEPRDFNEFVLTTFGRGFAEHFFFPFNQKFFKRDLKEISLEWTSWSIPRPNLQEVLNGAFGISDKQFGYNAEFFYPEGGIEELPKALARELFRPVETGKDVVKVNAGERRARLADGEEIKYERMISTLPLDRLTGLIEDAPKEVKEAAKRLEVLSVICVNLGIKGPAVSDRHWIYLPEPSLSFHRIGVYSNFAAIGTDRSSLYLEITAPGPLGGDAAARVKRAADAAEFEFFGTPFFRSGEHEVEVREAMVIPHGYVVYDHARAEALRPIAHFLKERHIACIGRYARWEYATMEDAVMQGREAAKS